jgi:HSP20 family protein
MNKKMLLTIASTFLVANSSYAGFFTHDFFKEFEDFGSKFHNINMYKNTKAQKFTVEVALPGFDKKDIKVKVDNKHGILTITAESKIEKAEEKKNEQNVYIYRSKSLAQSYFNRSFTLPEYVDFSEANHIETTYKNGILKIEFPLAKSVKADEITLQINGEDETTETEK